MLQFEGTQRSYINLAVKLGLDSLSSSETGKALLPLGLCDFSSRQKKEVS